MLLQEAFDDFEISEAVCACGSAPLCKGVSSFGCLASDLLRLDASILQAQIRIGSDIDDDTALPGSVSEAAINAESLATALTDTDRQAWHRAVRNLVLRAISGGL
jgi:hypothetical protein